jgi:transglutaminase-like putative cysteine protease
MDSQRKKGKHRMAETDIELYLASTPTIDSDNPIVAAFAAEATGHVESDPVSKAVKLYYAVRDGIWYDPYLPFYRPEHYRSSHVIKLGRAFCIGKAALLCALARACAIPARLGFANVRNHLATRQFIEFLGSDVFVFHGYTEFFLNDRWVKATPAFNAELCRKHAVAPLEFNGREDSVFHPYSEDHQRFMEYLTDHGTFADVPVDRIVGAMQAEYGRDRVDKWIASYEKSDKFKGRDFYQETVVKL